MPYSANSRDEDPDGPVDPGPGRPGGPGRVGWIGRGWQVVTAPGIPPAR
jgi:hypothetical protein